MNEQQASAADASARLASQIVERIVNDDLEDVEMPDRLSIADIEYNAKAFSRDRKSFARFNKKFGRPGLPCLDLGDDRFAPMAYEYWRTIQPRLKGEFGETMFLPSERPESLTQIRWLDEIEASENFIALATETLRVRIQSLVEPKADSNDSGGPRLNLELPSHIGGPPTMVSGCLFSVSSNSAGLRVHFSGAYRIAPLHFGHPTSPVTGILQAGKYVFGVDQGIYGNIIQWDHAIVPLPGPSKVHLAY